MLITILVPFKFGTCTYFHCDSISSVHSILLTWKCVKNYGILLRGTRSCLLEVCILGVHFMCSLVSERFKKKLTRTFAMNFRTLTTVVR